VPWTVESRNVTVHAADAPDPERVQGDPVKLPAAPVEEKEKVIVPAGVIGVPTVEASVTVASHNDAWFTATGE